MHDWLNTIVQVTQMQCLHKSMPRKSINLLSYDLYLYLYSTTHVCAI